MRPTVRLPDFRYRAADAGGAVGNEVCPVCTATSGDMPAPEASEVAQWEWVDRDRFRTMAAQTPRALSPWAVRQTEALGAGPLCGQDG